MTTENATDFELSQPDGNHRAQVVGIEFGTAVLRGALLDDTHDGPRLVATAEIPVDSPTGIRVGSSYNPEAINPALDTLISSLNPSRVRDELGVALSFGPPNSGVGSGPALPYWLEQQTLLLGEPMVCAGDLGIAFAPRQAVESLVAAVGACGLFAIRLDLAPMAAARVVDMHKVDTIVVGSGLGWQARMREAEVLEALELPGVDADSPLCIVNSPTLREPVSSYYDVGMSAELLMTDPDLAQLAVAVGAALGAYYDSPANLLDGWEVPVADLRERSKTSSFAGFSTAEDEPIEVKNPTLNLSRVEVVSPDNTEVPEEIDLDDKAATEADLLENDPLALAATAKTTGSSPFLAGRVGGESDVENLKVTNDVVHPPEINPAVAGAQTGRVPGSVGGTGNSAPRGQLSPLALDQVSTENSDRHASGTDHHRPEEHSVGQSDSATPDYRSDPSSQSEPNSPDETGSSTEPDSPGKPAFSTQPGGDAGTVPSTDESDASADVGGSEPESAVPTGAQTIPPPVWQNATAETPNPTPSATKARTRRSRLLWIVGLIIIMALVIFALYELVIPS